MPIGRKQYYDEFERHIVELYYAVQKQAELEKSAWLTVKKDIRDICICDNDCGSEFKNEEIDRILKIGNIYRSLSRTGTPMDNAVCESMCNIVKI